MIPSLPWLQRSAAQGLQVEHAHTQVWKHSQLLILQDVPVVYGFKLFLKFLLAFLFLVLSWSLPFVYGWESLSFHNLRFLCRSFHQRHCGDNLLECSHEPIYVHLSTQWTCWNCILHSAWCAEGAMHDQSRLGDIYQPDFQHSRLVCFDLRISTQYYPGFVFSPSFSCAGVAAAAAAGEFA